MLSVQLVVLCVTIASVIGDLPPGTRRNTYLPPEPTKGGYSYSKPTVPFPKPTPTAPFPTRPTPSFPGPRPTPSFPGPRPTPSFPGPRPTPTFPGPRPTPTYPGPPRTPGTFPTSRPTPPFPDYSGQQSGGDKNIIGLDVSIHENEMIVLIEKLYLFKRRDIERIYNVHCLVKSLQFRKN